MDQERYRACKVLTTQMTPDDTVRIVASGFGLDPQGAQKSSTVRQLEQFFIDTRRRGVSPVIIVDEAHNLPSASLEELRMLLNYCFEGTPLVQTFLLGQTQFRDTLAKGALEQIRQRVVASSHLRPLSASETRRYIEHRLRAVGWVENPIISEEVFSGVYQATRGIPRRINMVFDRLLLVGYVEERHDLGPDLVEIVMKEMRREGLLAHPAPADGASRV